MIPNHLSLLVTTFCNLQCPNCCFQIPKHVTMPAHHQTWEYFERAAELFQGIDALYVAGGEPTLHPQFERIAREFQPLFNAGSLILCTNGARVVEYGDSMSYFDDVRITAFDDPRSQAAIAWMREHSPDNLTIWPPDHVPITRRTKRIAESCDKRLIMVYALGRLYPCCEMPGIVGAQFIEPGKDWEQQLRQVPFACADCIFAPGEDAP